MKTVDRLGEAIKEIARGMTDHGKTSVRFTVAAGALETVYEVRLVSTRARPKRVGGVLVVYPRRG